MKVAVLHPEFKVRGGAERKALLLVRGLEEYDIDIFTYQFEKKDTFYELLDGLNLKVVSSFGNSRISKFCNLFRTVFLLKEYDLIHAHNFPANITAAIAGILFNIPVLWFCNEPLLFLEDPEKRENKFILKMMRVIEKLLVAKIDIVVSNSNNTAEQIKKAYNIVPRLVYSGVNTKIYSPGKIKHKKHLLVVSRIQKHKNIDFLIKIMPNIWRYDSNVVLNIVGDGNYLYTLKRKAEGNKKIIFHGNVSEKKKIALYRQSKVFVFPNPNEPLGVTPIEAQACGLPVVAFNSGGTKETIVDKKTGYLVKCEDEFIKRVIELLKDAKKCKKMGRNGVEKAKTFSIEQMINQTRKLYEELHG